jgi:hypothetical protein
MKMYQYPIVGVGIAGIQSSPQSLLPRRSAPADPRPLGRATPGDGETAEVELIVVCGDGAAGVEPPVYEAGPPVQQETGAVLVGETLPAGPRHIYTVGDPAAWRAEASPP